jgi:hypothetical protein
LIETAIGGASGVLLSPFLLVKTLKTGGKLFLAGYAGLENFLIEGLKSGEWTWQSAAIGAAAGLFVGYVVSPMLTNGTKLLKGLLNGGKTDLNTVDDILVDNMTKKSAADMREDIDKLFDKYDLDGQDGGKEVLDHQPRPDPQIEPKQTLDLDPRPDLQPDPKPEPQPDSKPESQPDPKPEPQPDSKPEPQPDPRPEPQPDQTPDEPVEDSNDGQELDVGEDEVDNPNKNDGHSSEDVNDREKESERSVSENQTSTHSGRFEGPQPSFTK